MTDELRRSGLGEVEGSWATEADRMVMLAMPGLRRFVAEQLDRDLDIAPLGERAVMSYGLSAAAMRAMLDVQAGIRSGNLDGSAMALLRVASLALIWYIEIEPREHPW